MAYPPLERIVAKEVSLGVVRDLEPPQEHVGLREIAPFKDVLADDVIFNYLTLDVDGMAPARAEDAEAEMAMKDDTVGTGRASILDWAIKDHYNTSDITRWRGFKEAAEALATSGVLPLLNSATNDFEARVARETISRRRKLDNRIEWLIWTALETNTIAYNDGKIIFSTSFGRPADQTRATPDDLTAGNLLWNDLSDGGDSIDPIGDFYAMDEFMYETYGVRMKRAYASRKVWNSIRNASRFLNRTGMTVGTNQPPMDPAYLIPGWGNGASAALAAWQDATGCEPRVYDSVMPTRALGSNTRSLVRFLNDDVIVFMPSPEDLAAIDDTEIGFAKTLTSPHVAGEMTPGFYEWEKDHGQDPWGWDRGTGIKCFPVFPHLEYTFVMKVR